MQVVQAIAHKIHKEVRACQDKENQLSIDFSLKTRTIITLIASGKPRASVEPKRETNNSPAPSSAQSYTVKSGDCLCAIARRFYGDDKRYIDIYNANKSIIGGNPNLIMPGQKLTIPV